MSWIFRQLRNLKHPLEGGSCLVACGTNNPDRHKRALIVNSMNSLVGRRMQRISEQRPQKEYFCIDSMPIISCRIYFVFMTPFRCKH